MRAGHVPQARRHQEQRRLPVREGAGGLSDALSRLSTFAYDAVGNLVGSTDALNYRTTFAYDSLDRLTTVTDALNGVTSY